MNLSHVHRAMLYVTPILQVETLRLKPQRAKAKLVWHFLSALAPGAGCSLKHILTLKPGASDCTSRPFPPQAVGFLGTESVSSVPSPSAPMPSSRQQPDREHRVLPHRTNIYSAAWTLAGPGWLHGNTKGRTRRWL